MANKVVVLTFAGMVTILTPIPFCTVFFTSIHNLILFKIGLDWEKNPNCSP